MTMFANAFKSSIRTLLMMARHRARNVVRARRYSKSNKPKVFVTQKMNPESMEALKKYCDVEMWESDDLVTHEELMQKVQDKDALFLCITERIDGEVLDAGKNLKVIATMSVGFDHIDLKAAKERNIRVGYTPGVVRNSTAELTVALGLMAGRRFGEALGEARDGGWSHWRPFWLCGQGFDSKVVGVAGAGSIGTQVMRIVTAFRAKKLLYYNKEQNCAAEEELGAKRVELDELCQKSDFIFTCVALTPETTKLFNEETFKMMKSNCVFVNTSRGPVVDQDALIKALEEKCIAAAGLDVTTPEPLPLDSPLFKLKNCVILPHVGTATLKARGDMAMITVKNIIRGLKGEKMIAELK